MRSHSIGVAFGLAISWSSAVIQPPPGRADQPENRSDPPIDRQAAGDLATLGAVGLGWTLTGVGIVREDLDTIAGGVLVTSYLPLGGQVIAGRWKLGLGFTGIKMLGFTTFLLSALGDEADDVIRKGPFKASLVLIGVPSAIEAGLAGRDLYRWYTGRERPTETRGPKEEGTDSGEGSTPPTFSNRLSLLGGVTLVDIFDFTACDEPEDCRTLHPARRVVGMYGAGIRW